MYYIKKLIYKLLAFPLWIVLSLVCLIVKPLFFLIRLMAIPGIIMSIEIMYLAFASDTYIMIIQSVAVALIAVILWFVSPKFAVWIVDKKDDLKDVALFPISIKAQYPFTVDYTYWENN